MNVEQQFRAILVASVVLSAFIVTPIAYMAADNQPPYEYDAENSFVVPNPTPSGNQLLVHWQFRRVNRVCSGSITRSVVDLKTKERITYDPTPAATNVDLAETYLNRTFYLPVSTDDGEKEYYADGEFHCNLLQHFWPLRVRTPRLRFYVSRHQ